MLDISKFKSEISLYGGSELKRTYYIDNKKYMVKFPDPIGEKRKEISYINNQYSEYLGCKIFSLFGIDTQCVSLVKGNFNGKNKIGVMCLDFLEESEKLVEFKNLSYSLDLNRKYTSDVLDIIHMIMNLDNFVNKDKFISYFYDVFIVDTLIGNTDRHLGNWGLIWKDGFYRLSPIYDCGSSLHSLVSLDEATRLINSPSELKNISINLKTAYKYNGKSMNYIDFYLLMPLELKESLIKMYKLIDMEKIKSIIFDTESLNLVQKEFYYKTIAYRKREILDKFYNMVINEK